MNPLDLQRIVDGELSHELRAELLRSLGPDSSQWQELALLFLEDQELSKQIRSEPPLEPLSLVRASLESDVLRTTHSKKSSLGVSTACRLRDFLSLDLEAVFGSRRSLRSLLLLHRLRALRSRSCPLQFQAIRIEIAQKILLEVPRSPNSWILFPLAVLRSTMYPLGGCVSKTLAIARSRSPWVDAREIDPQLILANNALEIAKLNQQLKRRGYELEARPTMYSGALEDGRRIMVPIHNVSLRPYGL